MHDDIKNTSTDHDWPLTVFIRRLEIPLYLKDSFNFHRYDFCFWCVLRPLWCTQVTKCRRNIWFLPQNRDSTSTSFSWSILVLLPYLVNFRNKTRRSEDRNFKFKVCSISFERPVNYLCDAWHVFPPKYEAWTHFNRR